MARCSRVLILLVVFLSVRVTADPTGPFVWGDTTRVANAGWGRMISLKSDGWMNVDTLYPHGGSVLQIQTSADGARTWTPLSTVAEAGRNLDNGELIQLPGGHLLLTGRSVVSSHGPNGVQSYHLPVYRSGDGGKTWAFLSQIDTSEPGAYQPGRPSLGLWEPHFFLLPGDALACAYADETRARDHPAYSQIVSERVSHDGGATWGAKIVLAAQLGGGGQRPGMPVLARMKNGQWIAVYEVAGLGNADVYFKTSRDGVTWPPGIGIRVPGQHAGPWVTALRDGRLVVSSCANQISYSDDLGATWLLATPAPWPLGQTLSFPAIYQTGPNEIAVMNTDKGVSIRWGRIGPTQVWPPKFASDFTGGSDAGWTRYGGEYGFANGAYLLQNAATTGKSLTGNPHWGDGVLEADVMLTSAGNAGLMLRTTNADAGGPDAGFGYYVGLDSSGSLFVARNADNYAELARVPLAVPLNVWHRVKVVMSGATLTVWVDNAPKPQLTVQDSSFLHGQIGVRAHYCDAEFRRVLFTQAVAHKP